MHAGLLVVSRSPALRGQVAALTGYRSLDFLGGDSAFLFACSRIGRLSGLIIDEGLGTDEVMDLLRRVRLLCPDVPTILVATEDLDPAEPDSPRFPGLTEPHNLHPSVHRSGSDTLPEVLRQCVPSEIARRVLTRRPSPAFQAAPHESGMHERGMDDEASRSGYANP